VSSHVPRRHPERPRPGIERYRAVGRTSAPLSGPSWSIVLSRGRSATTCLRRRFSSSSCFTPKIVSLTPSFGRARRSGCRALPPGSERIGTIDATSGTIRAAGVRPGPTPGRRSTRAWGWPAPGPARLVGRRRASASRSPADTEPVCAGAGSRSRSGRRECGRMAWANGECASPASSRRPAGPGRARRAAAVRGGAGPPHGARSRPRAVMEYSTRTRPSARRRTRSWASGGRRRERPSGSRRARSLRGTPTLAWIPTAAC